MSSLLPFVPRLTLTLIGDGLPSDFGRVRDFEVAAMLADLSGFTALVESLTARLGGQAAERLQDVLNRCFVPITEIVDRTGGQVLAFPGDAALGIWLGEMADPNGLVESVLRAIDCGLELRDRLDGLVVGDEAVVRLRVAISAGSVRAALVGGVDGRWTVVVHGRAIEQLGDTLALAKPGEVILSAAARELCRTRVTTTPRGSHGVVISGAPAAPRPPAGLPDVVAPPDLLPRLVPASVRVRFEAGQHAWMSEFRTVTSAFIQLDGATRDDRALHLTVRTIQTVLTRFDGELNQVVADDKGLTAVAVFGLLQQTHEDDPVRALTASRELQAMLRSEGINARIGVTTGHVFAGTRGGGSRAEFAILGRTVVLAARLSAAAVDILCDGATRTASLQVFQLQQATPVVSKGQGLVTDVWQPIDVLPQRARRHHEIVGRTTERRVIEQRLATLVSGGGGVIVIEGEAGIGKSALVTSVRERAGAHTVTCAVGTGDSIQHAATLRPWRTIVSDLLGVEVGMGPAAVRARVRSLVGEAQDDWIPLLNPVLPVSLPENESTTSLSPDSRARTTRDLLVSLLDAVASRRPLLVVLEDAHWMDSASWDLTEEIVGRVPHVLLLLTTRAAASTGERLSRLTSRSDATLVRLNTMPPNEIRDVVAQRVGVARVSDELAEWIHRRSEGHPLFAEEVALTLLERGALVIRDGTCHLVADAATTAVQTPETVRGVVASRIDALSAADQLTLKVAAVLGREFELDALGAIHPLAGGNGPLAPQVARVAAAGLLSVEPEVPSRASFSHGIVQEVAYELLPFAQRRLLHHRTAEFLETAGADSDRDLSGVLAHHWEQAKVAAKAIQYLERAGEQALLKDSSNPEAEEFFTRLIRLAEQQQPADRPSRPAGPPDAFRVSLARWERMRSQAVVRQGRHAAGLRHLERSLNLLGHSLPVATWPCRLEALGGVIRRLAVRPGAPRRLDLPSLERSTLLEIVRAYDGFVQLLYLGEAGPTGQSSEGALLSALALLRSARLAERAGPSPELSQTYAVVAQLVAMFRRPRLASYYATQARAIAEQVADKQALFRALTMAQLPAFICGRWQEAEENLQQGLALGDALRNGHDCLISAYTSGYISLHRGRLDEARARFDEILQRAERSDDVLMQLWARVAIAEVLMRQGRLTDAIQSAETCLEVVERTRAVDQNSRFQAHGVLGSSWLRLGDPARAAEHLAPALAAANAGATLSYSAHAGLVGVAEMLLAESDRGGGEVATSEMRLRQWIRRLRAVAFCRPILEPWSLYFRAVWHRRHRRVGIARRQLLAAIRLADRLEMPYESARSRAELALLSTARRAEPLGSPQ